LSNLVGLLLLIAAISSTNFAKDVPTEGKSFLQIQLPSCVTHTKQLQIMQKTRETKGIAALCLGMLLLVAILSLVVWCEYKTNHIIAWIVLCFDGLVFWFIGLAAAGSRAPDRSIVKSALIGSSSEFDFMKFYLNGYFLQPYEEQTLAGVKQFRLSATPQMSPEREAAFIRYLINEGLTEKMWPRISEKIEEEANWAFFV
jgi:hypothetical protein